MLQDMADRDARRWSRSTNGCVTCVRSKVKCSENRPVCQRCSGLQRHCQWREHRVPLRERRRGFGSLKSRLHYVPPPILPSQSTASHAAQFTPESDENPRDWESSLSETAVEATESMATTHLVLNRTAHIAEQATMTNASRNAVAPHLSTLNARHIPSRCSILFGPLEQDALYVFENVFSKLSPKTFLWSKLAIVLHYAYDDATIMHLLLASCLSTVARGHSDHQVLRTAKSHFTRGTTYFVDRMQDLSYNHSKDFMAFWLLQLTYRAIWDDKSRSAMHKLSIALVDYVRKHHIFELFSSNSALFESPGGSTSAEGDFPADLSSLNPAGLAKKSLLASLLLFTAYEDLDSEFCGSGGQFASWILSGDDTSRALFACSRNIHADFFGPQYPWEELMDDVERSRPLELHFFANICLNRLNRAHKCGFDIGELQEIEATLRKLREVRRSSFLNLVPCPACCMSARHIVPADFEHPLLGLRQEYSAIFRLAETPHSAGRKLITTSYSIVAHFNAVLVCVLVAIVSVTPSLSVQRDLAVAKDNLLRVTFRMVTHNPDQPVMWRNQWAVFVMARETDDEIHRDWLLQKLGNSTYAAALKNSSAQNFNSPASRDD